MPKITKTLTPKQLDQAIRQFEKGNESKKKITVGECTGLYLLVQRLATGISKRWIVRCRVDGKDYDRSLNGLTYPQCGLSDARRLAGEYFASLATGVDPLVEAKKAKEEKRKAITFKECALAYIAENSAKWVVNNKLREKRTLESLTRRAFPYFGDVPIDEVIADHVFKALMDGNWVLKVKRCTSRQFRDHVNAVCEWAQGKRYRPTDMALPAHVNKGSPLAILLAPYAHLIPKGGHNATIDYVDAPEFFRELCGLNPSNGRNALIFGMLTALRGGSYTQLRWSDIDLENQICMVREETRKKKDGDFRTYLSPYAVAFLKTLPRWKGDYIFSSDDGVTPITLASLMRAIKTMNERRTARGLKEWRDWSMPNDDGTFPVVKPHALCRTVFSTWSEDDEHGNDEIINSLAVELCLDHDVSKAKRDTNKGAYLRGDKRKSRIDALTLFARFLITGRYPNEEDGQECEEWRAIVGGS